MSSKTENNVETTIHLVPLSDIFVDRDWNGRSGAWDDLTDVKNDDLNDTSTFGSLVESIAKHGQDEPVTLRPMKGKKPFFLVSGYRRFAAISRIAEMNKDPNPTIKATVRQLDDIQARELNIRENAVRDNLKGPDLAWLVKDLADQMKRKGFKVTDTAVAEKVGKAQPYVGRLLNIADNVTPEVFKEWRDNSTSVPVLSMVEVSKLPAADQAAAFQKLVTSPAKKGRGVKREWIDIAKEKLESKCQELGELQQMGLINVLINWDHPDIFGKLLVLKAGTTEAQIKDLIQAARKAYVKGTTTETPKVPEAIEQAATAN